MIRKAVIPIAGLGTRMGPLARAVPKAMFPLVDAQGRARPVVHFIVNEALTAGVERVALVVSPAHLDMVRVYFAAADEHESACQSQLRGAGGPGDTPRSPNAAEPGLSARIEYIVQARPEGFGAAVALAEPFVGGEPFLLMLGDHVHVATPGRAGCAAQVARAFERYAGAAMVGMQPVGPDELCRVGVGRGEPVNSRSVGVGRGEQVESCRNDIAGGEQVYLCTELIEKPDVATARARLVTPGLSPDRFLAHAGIFAFSPAVFDCLDELGAAERPAGAELQLTDAQRIMLERHPNDYRLLRIAGVAYDTGTPAGYATALAAIRGT